MSDQQNQRIQFLGFFLRSIEGLGAPLVILLIEGLPLLSGNDLKNMREHGGCRCAHRTCRRENTICHEGNDIVPEGPYFMC